MCGCRISGSTGLKAFGTGSTPCAAVGMAMLSRCCIAISSSLGALHHNASTCRPCPAGYAGYSRVQGLIDYVRTGAGSEEAGKLLRWRRAWHACGTSNPDQVPCSREQQSLLRSQRQVEMFPGGRSGKLLRAWQAFLLPAAGHRQLRHYG